MLVSMKELLDVAATKNIAVAAINVSNMESIMALLEIADNRSEAVIIQVAPIQLKIQNISYDQIVRLVKLFLEDVKVSAALHLDHAETVEDCIAAIDAGFTSVMFDGSLGDYTANVKNTCEVVAYAKSRGVTVEAELGKVGGSEGQQSEDAKSNLTDPSQVKEFVRLTDVDCLAVAIGNAHGLYKSTPKLDFERLEEIANITDIPLVLHGGTGISAIDIDKAIDFGIRKINFFTEVDRKFVEGFVKAYEADKNIYMMSACEAGRQNMMLMIDDKMKVCRREEQL